MLLFARLPVFSGLNQERIVDARFPRFKPVLKRLSIVNAGVKASGVCWGNHVIFIATGVHEAVHQDSIDLTVIEWFVVPG